MRPIIEKKIITESELFMRGVDSMYRMMLSQHTQLMRVWDKPNAEEVLKGEEIGTKALSIFIASSAIQTILKDADPLYEIITPYKWADVQEPVLDEDGNKKMNVSYEVVMDEETGFQKLDEDGKVVTKKIETPLFRTVKKKVPLNPIFNPDGSLDKLEEIN